MKRITLAIAVAAIVSALAAMAFAQESSPATPSAEPAKPATTEKSATKSSTSKTHATHHYDLNTATRDELMKLPGINDALADKIIAARPFKSKSELESKKILTQKEYSKVHTMVTVKSSTMAGNGPK